VYEIHRQTCPGERGAASSYLLGFYELLALAHVLEVWFFFLRIAYYQPKSSRVGNMIPGGTGSSILTRNKKYTALFQGFALKGRATITSKLIEVIRSKKTLALSAHGIFSTKPAAPGYYLKNAHDEHPPRSPSLQVRHSFVSVLYSWWIISLGIITGIGTLITVRRSSAISSVCSMTRA